MLTANCVMSFSNSFIIGFKSNDGNSIHVQFLDMDEQPIEYYVPVEHCARDNSSDPIVRAVYVVEREARGRLYLCIVEDNHFVIHEAIFMDDPRHSMLARNDIVYGVVPEDIANRVDTCSLILDPVKTSDGRTNVEADFVAPAPATPTATLPAAPTTAPKVAPATAPATAPHVKTWGEEAAEVDSLVAERDAALEKLRAENAALMELLARSGVAVPSAPSARVAQSARVGKSARVAPAAPSARATKPTRKVRFAVPSDSVAAVVVAPSDSATAVAAALDATLSDSVVVAPSDTAAALLISAVSASSDKMASAVAVLPDTLVVSADVAPSAPSAPVMSVADFESRLRPDVEWREIVSDPSVVPIEPVVESESTDPTIRDLVDELFPEEESSFVELTDERVSENVAEPARLIFESSYDELVGGKLILSRSREKCVREFQKFRRLGIGYASVRQLLISARLAFEDIATRNSRTCRPVFESAIRLAEFYNTALAILSRHIPEIIEFEPKKIIPIMGRMPHSTEMSPIGDVSLGSIAASGCNLDNAVYGRLIFNVVTSMTEGTWYSDDANVLFIRTLIHWCSGEKDDPVMHFSGVLQTIGERRTPGWDHVIRRCGGDDVSEEVILLLCRLIHDEKALRKEFNDAMFNAHSRHE